MNDKHTCTVENAPKFLDWIQTRGGVAVWRSINLSNPNASWSSPATIRRGDIQGHSNSDPDADEIIQYPPPNWQCGATPSRIIKDAAEILVETDREVRRFHVAVRRAGLSLKVTDGGTRRIRAAVAKAGDGASYHFDYSEQSAVICVPEKSVPLSEWKP